jgi:hypothetical protein
VIHDLEGETESLREEMRASTGMSVIKNHTELLVEEQNVLLFRMLHDMFSVLHRKRSTWTLKTLGGMPEVFRKQYDRQNSDLLDEHDKWFRNPGFDQKPEKYLEWYNAWMDTKHGLYVLYVADMSMQPYLISSRLQLNPLPESLKEWCTSKGKTIPPWESLVLFVLWVKEKLLSLRNRQKSLVCGLALFHMMKTTYSYDKPEHRNQWIVDFTIYSVDKDASDDDTSLSTSKMRVRAHIYPDHSNQVNFSSHEYQTCKATDDIPERTGHPSQRFGSRHLSSRMLD